MGSGWNWLRAGLLVLALVLSASGALLVYTGQGNVQAQGSGVELFVPPPVAAVPTGPTPTPVPPGVTLVPTLREAITRANSAAGDVTIRLAAGTYPLDVPGAGEDNNASGDLDITKAQGKLTIVGAGAGKTIIQWANSPNDRLIDVTSTAIVHLRGMTLQNGMAPGDSGTEDANGGLIRNAGTLTLNDVSLLNGQALHGNGGAIFNTGTLIIGDQQMVQIAANSAASGGGIANAGGTLWIFQLSLQSNQAADDGGGLLSTSGEVHSSGPSFSATGNSAAGNGGGLALEGGLALLSQSTLQGNQAGKQGGGLWLGPNMQRVELYTAAIKKNQAGAGGGLATAAPLTKLYAVALTENTATNGDGGGALALTGATLQLLAGSQVVNNQVAGASHGGGVASQAGAALVIDGTQVMNNALLLGNTLTSGVSVAGNNAAYGGGIWSAGKLLVGQALVQGNTALSQGGGLWISSGTGSSATIQSHTRITGNTAGDLGGGIYLAASAALTLSDSAVDGNVATNGAGGGMLVEPDATAAIDHSTLWGNQAGAAGGGIDIRGSLTVVNSTIGGNRGVLPGGGGLYVEPGGAATLAFTTVVANQARSGGGVYAVVGGSLSLGGGVLLAANLPQSCSGMVTSKGGNLDDDGSCQLNGKGDLSSTDPQLGGLLTQGEQHYYVLAASSPAIDAAAKSCPKDDQLHQSRPQGKGCDIGAMEFAALSVTPTATARSATPTVASSPTPTPSSMPTPTAIQTPASTPTSLPTPMATPGNAMTPTPTLVTPIPGIIVPPGGITPTPTATGGTMAPVLPTPTPTVSLPNTGQALGKPSRIQLGFGLMGLGGASLLGALVITMAPRRRTP